MKHLIILIALTSIISGCGNRNKTTKEDHSTKKGIIVESFEDYKENANTDINAARLDNNILTLSISYSGGCEKHEFSLLGSKLIAKSLPPQRGIMLYHKNNNDSCRELITEELSFDISEFSHTKGEEITLILNNWKEPISFILK